MKKILLAIDGVAPDSRIIDYAVALCRRMRAGLEVLQVLGPQSCKKYLEKIKLGARHTQSMFEDAMVTATFAEAGQHEIAEQLRKQASAEINRLIPEDACDSIHYHFTLKSGNSYEEIVRYVSNHRDVVLTLYDPAGATDERASRSGKKKDAIRQIQKKLTTPLVIMREM